MNNNNLDIILVFDDNINSVEFYQEKQVKKERLKPMKELKLKKYDCVGNLEVKNTRILCNSLNSTNFEQEFVEIINNSFTYYETEVKNLEKEEYFEYEFSLVRKLTYEQIGSKHYYYFNNVNFRKDELKTYKVVYNTKIGLDGKFSVYVKKNNEDISQAVELDPWFNSNWLRAKNITISNNDDIGHTFEYMEVNLSNLTLSNTCAKELIIVNNNSQQEDMDVILDGSNEPQGKKWCLVSFLVNVTTGATINYTAYYHNALATEGDENLTLVYQDFENGTLGELASSWSIDTGLTAGTVANTNVTINNSQAIGTQSGRINNAQSGALNDIVNFINFSFSQSTVPRKLTSTFSVFILNNSQNSILGTTFSEDLHPQHSVFARAPHQRYNGTIKTFDSVDLIETNLNLTGDMWQNLTYVIDNITPERWRLYMNQSMSRPDANYTFRGTPAFFNRIGFGSNGDVVASGYHIDNVKVVVGEIYNESSTFSIGSVMNSEPYNLSIASMSLTPTNPVSTDNLNASFFVEDDLGRLMNVSVIWYRNNISVTGSNLFNNYAPSSFVSTSLHNANTTRGENWSYSAQVISTVFSGNITNSTSRNINNSIPFLILRTPLNNSFASGGVNLSCIGNDTDNDLLSYEFIGDTANPPTTLLQNNTLGSYLWTNLTGSNKYYWQCNVRDSLNSVNRSSTFQLNVSIIQYCIGGSNSTHSLAYNFTFAKEIDKIDLSNVTFDITALTFTTTRQANSTFSFRVINTTNVTICLTPANATFQVDAQIDYIAPTFDKRQHYLVNNTASNQTQHTKLYLLEVLFGSSTTIKVIDQFFNGIPDAYVFAERFYTEDGIYRNVASVKTDDAGKGFTFLQHLIPHYRFLVIHNDTLKLVSSPLKIITVSGDETIITLQIGGSTPAEIINSYNNIQYSMAFNNLTRSWVVSYVDNSNNLERGCLRVKDALNGTQYCNTCSTDNTATLTCTIPSATSLRAFPTTATFYESGAQQELNQIIAVDSFSEFVPDSLGRKLGILAPILAVLLLATIVFIGLFNLIAGLVLAIVGLFIIFILDLMPIPFTAIWGIVVVVLLIIFRSRRT